MSTCMNNTQVVTNIGIFFSFCRALRDKMKTTAQRLLWGRPFVHVWDQPFAHASVTVSHSSVIFTIHQQFMIFTTSLCGKRETCKNSKVSNFVRLSFWLLRDANFEVANDEFRKSSVSFSNFFSSNLSLSSSLFGSVCLDYS